MATLVAYKQRLLQQQKIINANVSHTFSPRGYGPTRSRHLQTIERLLEGM